MVIVGLLLIATYHSYYRKEGFNEFDFDSRPYIPYVSQDLMCLILESSGVKGVNKYGIIIENCSRDKKLKEDDKNYCPS